MRVCFFHSEKPRERLLADAFLRGLHAHGDEGVMRELTGKPQKADDCEVAVMVGVKSRELWEVNWKAGVHVVMIDKGYSRHRKGGPVRLWEYWRVSVDGHHPTRTLMDVARPHDRLERLGLKLQPWREDGKHILLAGSSEKYHRFYDLPHPTEYAEKIVRSLASRKRPILYRPKPSWKNAVKVSGTEYSPPDQPISRALRGAWALVTHGSNACFEAVIHGIPCIVLGDAVARPISSTDIRDLDEPLMVDDRTRLQWLANLAYCQWTLHEFARGEAWATIRPQIYG